MNTSKILKFGLVTTLFIIALTTIWPTYHNAESKTDSSSTQQAKVKSKQLVEQSFKDAQDTRQIIKSEAKTETLNSCNEFLAIEQNFDTWAKQKRTQIRTFINHHKNSSTDERVLAQFYIDSGIGLQTGRLIYQGYDKTFKLPPYTRDPNITKAPVAARIKAIEHTTPSKYSQLSLLISTDEIPKNAYYKSSKGSFYLFGYILTEGKANKEDLANLLLSLKVPIKASDLLVASKVGLPLNIIEQMYILSGIDPTQTLTFQQRSTSLALMSLVYNQPEHALFWVNQGSPLKPDPFDANILDILARYANNSPNPLVDELFSQAMHQGIKPRFPSTANRLKAIISDHLMSQYDDSNDLVPEAELTQNDMQQVANLVNQLHTSVLTGVVTFDLYQQPKHQCLAQLGKRLTHQVMNQKPASRPSPLSQQKPVIHTNEAPDEEDAISLEDRTIRLTENPDGPYAQLDDQSFETKQLIENHRQQELSTIMRQIQQTEQSAPSELLKQIMAYAQQKQWTKVFELLEKAPENTNDIRSSLVMIAVSNSAQLSVVEKLLRDGDQLHSSIITTLITTNNVEMAKALLNWGLDLQSIQLGYSPVALAARTRSKEMLLFLLAQGVTIDSQSNGYDALDFALLDYVKGIYGTDIIKILLDAGAIVEQSHKQITNQLLPKKLDKYNQLIVLFPQLR